ncbi:unnamed protein product [Phaeothamnion confervicola]
MQALVKLVLEMKTARDAAEPTGPSAASSTERVVLLYSADVYGQSAALAFLQATKDLGVGREPAPSAGVDVVQSVLFQPDDEADWGQALADVRGSFVRIVVLLTEGYGGAAGRMLGAAQAAGMVDAGWQWYLGGDAAYDGIWFAANESSQTADSDAKRLAFAARGTLGVRPCAPAGASATAAFAERWQVLDPVEFPGAGPRGLRTDGTVEPLYLFAYDAVWTLARALAKAAAAATDADGGGTLPAGQFALAPYDLSDAPGCVFGPAWDSGNAVRAALAATRTSGAAGRVEFDADGAASGTAIGGPSLCVANLQPSVATGAAWVDLFEWSPADGIAAPYTRVVEDFFLQVYPGGAAAYPSDKPTLSGMHIRVLTKPATPFMFIEPAEGANASSTNSYVYTGISVRIMEELAAALNFTFEFFTAPNITASTIVATVAAGDYDIGISAITVTGDRWKIVGFSYPYYDLGLAFVYKQPAEAPVPLFRIFSPFTVELWICVVMVAITVCGLFWMYEGIINDDFTHMPFSPIKSFGKTLYVTLALLFQQLTHKPESAEGYILTTGYMFFAFILAASYTAELASYLTITKAQNVVINAEAISSGTILQSQVAVLNGSSIEEAYQRDILACTNSAACSAAAVGYVQCFSFDECFQMVEDGVVIATLSDSPIAEYNAANVYCDLVVDQDLFDLQNYGIVFQKDSPFADEFNLGVLALREAGIIATVNDAYLGGEGGSCAPSDTSTTGGASLAGGDNKQAQATGFQPGQFRAGYGPVWFWAGPAGTAALQNRSRGARCSYRGTAVSAYALAFVYVVVAAQSGVAFFLYCLCLCNSLSVSSHPLSYRTWSPAAITVARIDS